MFSSVPRHSSWARRASQSLVEFLASPKFAWLLVATYSFAFSLYSSVRYLGLQTGAWDTGAYNQALYTTLFSGKTFYYTADLPANPTGSMFGIHFSPILLALVPFYTLFPGPITLLTAQAVAIGLGALPVYYLARHWLKDRLIPTTLAFAYLVSPLTIGLNWFNFHPEAFLPATVLGTVYFWSKRRWTGYFACLIAALACIETAPVIVGFLSLYFAWQERARFRSVRTLRDLRSSQLLVPLISIALSGVWLMVALSIIRILNPINVFYYGASPLYWTVLGAKNLSQVPLRVLMSPASALTAFAYDIGQKLTFVFSLFACLLFLPIRSRGYALLTLPWLSVALLSNYPPFYLLTFQYVAFVLPFIFAGAVVGFRHLENWNRHLAISPALVRRVLAIVSVLGLIVLSPIVPWLTGNATPPPPLGVFSQGSHEADVRQVVSLIPSTASVLTQPNIFPLVSSRVNAFTVPIYSLFPLGTSFNLTFAQWLEESEYVLLDPATDMVSSLLTLPRIRALQIHELFVQFDSILLFKKSFMGSTTIIHHATIVLDSTNLVSPYAATVVDSNSTFGKAIVHRRNSSNPFWNSPEFWLPAGSYNATFRLRAVQDWTGRLVEIGMDRYSDWVESAPVGNDETGYNYHFYSRTTFENESRFWLTSLNFTSGGYRDWGFQFSSNGTESFGVTGEVLTNMTDIYLDSIIIHQNAT